MSPSIALSIFPRRRFFRASSCKTQALSAYLGRLTQLPFFIYWPASSHTAFQCSRRGGQHAHLFQIGNAPSQIAPWEECGWLATLPWPCRLSILSQGCVPISSDGLHPDRLSYALPKTYQPWPCPIIPTHNFYSPASPSGV